MAAPCFHPLGAGCFLVVSFLYFSHSKKNTFDLWAKILALTVVYLFLARHSKLVFSALASVVGSEKQNSFANMSIYKHFFYQMGAKTNKFI